MFRSSLPGRCFVLAAIASFMAPALSGQTFQRILGTGDPVPGGAGTVQFFTQAPACGGGAVAFTEVDSSSGAPVETLMTVSGGVFQRVVSVGEFVPAWGQTLQSISRVALDRDGSVAFLGSDTGFRFAVITDQGGTLRSLLGSNTAIPNGGGARFTAIANISLRADGGFIVFSGGGNLGTRSLSGVFSVESATGQLRTLAWEGTSPAGIGTVLGTGSCDVRDGQVAFAAQVQTAAGTVDGIYVCSAAGGPLAVVVDTSVTNPVTGQPFGNITAPEIDEDDVAYLGFEGRFTNQGIHSTYSAPLPAGVSLPGVGPAGSLEHFHLDRERIVFEAKDTTPARNSQGLFLYDCGAITKIVGPGDTVDGKTVLRLVHGDEALDGDQLALYLSFTDNTDAIYLVDLSDMTGLPNYGAGLPGELGLAPRIEGYGCALVGTTFRVELRDGPSGLVGGMFIGAAPENMPAFGGTVLARPDVVLRLMLQPPSAGLPRPHGTILFVVPPVPSLAGTSIYAQAHYFDPAAVLGVSFTPGLRVDLR